jgi:DNA recombination-dependent growth factor C
LDDENLLSYITDGGCLVDEVGLTYDDRIEFTLRSGAWLSKMKFKDVVFENEATDYEDINQAIDANYALMLGEHRALLDFLSKEASVQ